MGAALRVFQLRVTNEILTDLHERLSRIRWPDEAPDSPAWQYGTDLTYLQRLVAYWRDGYDWRAQEALLNSFPQYVAPVAGVDVHFLHARGVGPNPLPLIVSHGWPGSVLEFHKLIPLLTDPARHGGDAVDAFSVVAPSLPGYTLSFKPGQPRVGLPAMADIFAELMVDVLGYDRFGAQGGDLGAFVSAGLGLNHAQHVLGIHLNLLPLRRDEPPPLGDDPELVAWREELDHWLREESGYASIQGTKPQTLAYALADSPVGLAAWIVEKFRSWSDCDGNVETCFTRDELLTNIMLY
ncbi:MAG: epoxide hydrolase family protein [Chloroflexota bacterium]